MVPSPVLAIPAAAFAFPDLIAVFDTSVFSPFVITVLLLECSFLVFGCIVLWQLARPLRPRMFFAMTRRRARTRPATVSTALKFNAPSLRPGMLLQKQIGRFSGLRATQRSLPDEAATTKAQ